MHFSFLPLLLLVGFWGVELAFQRIPGVVSTAVGYTQGRKRDPKYREVCSGQTGHTEAVAVDYDPAVVSYEDLLALFWDRLGSNALTLNQVGNDVGTQYRSGLYFLNSNQEALARASAERRSVELGKPVVVEVKPAEGKPFYLAVCHVRLSKHLERGIVVFDVHAFATDPRSLYWLFFCVVLSPYLGNISPEILGEGRAIRGKGRLHPNSLLRVGHLCK